MSQQTKLEGARGIEGSRGLSAGFGGGFVSYGPRRREALPTVDAIALSRFSDPPNYVRLIFGPGESHAVGGGAPSYDTYAVTVSDGVVCEHITDAGLDGIEGADASAIKLHKCPSRLDGGNLREFPIEGGEAIFIRVVDDGTGHIGLPSESDFDESVDLVVMPKDQMSLNLIQTIQDGIYYYKLAELDVTGGNVKLVPFLSGSNIHHLSGLVCDAVLEDCSGDPGNPYADPPVPSAPAAIIQRLSFNRGVIVALNQSYETRPLATIKSVATVEPCCTQ